MPYYGFYEGKELQKYLRYFEAHSTNIKGAQFIVDSLKKADGEFSIDMFTRKKDIEVVDSAFLVEHIEWAFKVWKEQPWGENVNFEEFSNSQKTQFKEIISWGKKTEKGDKSELPFEVDNSVWELFQSETDICTGEKCPYKGKCFFLKSS